MGVTRDTNAYVNKNLCKDGLLAAGIQRGVVFVLHSQSAVDVETGHGGGTTGLRVLQALGDEGRAALGQQQVLLYTLGGDSAHNSYYSKTAKGE